MGSGVSRGIGQHFLFKVADNGPSLTPPGRYFEFPADADEDDLILLDDAGLADTTLTDYKAIVDPIVASGGYYDVMPDTPTEVPDSEGDFTGSGMGNMRPGGM